MTRPLIGDAHCNKPREREGGSVCVCIGLGIRIGLPIAVAIKQRVSCKRIKSLIGGLLSAATVVD